jgi:prepilin-type N-terminal cleavage/methylation domain-containing protein
MKTHRPIPNRSRLRQGFSLTEVMMAMTLLSIVLLSMARMSMVVSARGRANDIVAKRNAVLIQQANKYGAMPYDSLITVHAGFPSPGTAQSASASATFTAGDFKFTRRIAVTTSGVNRTLRIQIVPTLDTTKKDSVMVYRSKPAGSPLCVGC